MYMQAIGPLVCLRHISKITLQLIQSSVHVTDDLSVGKGFVNS
jgi:hypothetical protein